STQWSRRMNGLKLWLSFQVHGRQAYEEHIDRQLKLAGEFAGWVRRSEHFELAAEPDLTIVNFRVKNGDNQAVVDAVTRDGRRWISTTMVNGQSVIRMMVISYLTSEENLRDLQQALEAAVRGSLASQPQAQRSR
ncbi:MAG TPA: pyridoxal-dependent decarboxylase, partial [Terriglobales bacterium]|nr:pyridoxal-dependent decarboxylase [Terriglobales bacterium]